MKQLYARDSWINGQYYNLGASMNLYLLSGPRILDNGASSGHVQMKATYRVDNVMANYTWTISINNVELHVDYSSGSTWKTTVYADVDNEDSINFAYLPQTAQTLLTETSVSQLGALLDIRKLGKDQYWQLDTGGGFSERWMLREGYFGNDPGSAANGEYVFNRTIALHIVQYGQSAYLNMTRKQGQVTPDTTQNDALTGHDASNNFTYATQIGPSIDGYPYEGIVCASDPLDNDDYYKFNVQNGQCIYARLISSGNLDFNVELLNPSGNLVDSSNNGAGQIDSVFSIANAAGYWRLHISRATGEGKYFFYLYVNTYAHGMKTGVNGYFYNTTQATYLLKVNLIFDNSDLVGDQAPNQVNGYNFPFPDGNVDVYDLALVSLKFGLSEGQPGWVYMADVTPDRTIDIFDISPISLHFGKSGSYMGNPFSGVTVECVRSGGNSTLTPDQKGFVFVPADTAAIYVKRNGTPIGAMIIFYRN